MKGFFARCAVALQERMTGESADHMRDIHAGSPAVFWRLTLATALWNHQKALPRDIMALKQGVSPAIIRAAATGALAELSKDTRLAYDFAYAVAASDPRAEDLRALIEQHWGKAGLAEFALVIATVRTYPALKRAMGYARTCQRVTIEGETLEAHPARERAA
jgi:hypothetical protein